jgi:hypothetical protein
MYFLWVPHQAGPRGSACGSGVPKVLDPFADASVLRASLQEFDHDELVSVWESSDHRLRSECDPGRLLALVTLRALMLDELESRSPRRYQRWLRAGGPRGH